MTTPTIISIRKVNLVKLGYSNLQEWLSDQNHVYIGRNVHWVKGANSSKWRNPYSVKKYGLDKSLQLYRQHLFDTGLIDDLDELSGKVLGCWCKPNRCHGDILVELFKKS